jgi:hypothetical protein
MHIPVKKSIFLLLRNSAGDVIPTRSSNLFLILKFNPFFLIKRNWKGRFGRGFVNKFDGVV